MAHLVRRVPSCQVDGKIVDRKQAGEELLQTARISYLPPWKERSIRIGGVGEVPSIEVGTRHVITAACTQQLTVIAMQFHAALGTVLTDILLFRLGFGKFCFGPGGFSLHRFDLARQSADPHARSALLLHA